ncbi:protein mono-ADP-ribosyltransferase PARP14-like [Saccostrea cucullata]|uniref:protein mono-ADP-ribosyltransferase PARP14-like n=1 Tax=Saccostrea cuccullata TaxID=36930 RepID=UPI002ED2B38A
MKTESNMKKHNVTVTVNGDKSQMPSKYIIHVDVSGGEYKKRITDVFKKVEEMKLKSVAFPALGTGQGGHQQKVEDFAQEIFDAVNKVSSSTKTISEVHVIIYDHQMTQQFIIAMQKCFEAKGAKPKGYFDMFSNFLSGGKHESSKRWKPVFADKPEDQSSAVIVVFADSDKDIEAGIKKLESLLDADFTTKDYPDPIIKHITQGQVNALHNLKQKFDIDVTIDKEKGVVTLHGTNEALLEAADHVHGLLRDADRSKQAKLEAELVSDIVQWYFVDNSDGQNELLAYPKNINLLVEKAYRNKQPDVKFTDQAGTEYTINFNNMEEYPSDDPTDVTTVTRRDKIKDSTFEPPPEWSQMKDSENLVVVMVQSGSPEYTHVINKFQQEVGNRNIVKLERIQNKMLYQQYVAKKKLLDTQNPPGTQNERELWHGTAPEAVNSINSLGFNRSYCGKNAVAYGEGVYFAVNAGYSAQDTYSRRDPSGNKRMYLCKVLTGEFTVGKGGMRVPPAKGQQSHILYDSVVNNMANPVMYIIFNDTQGYPDYLITFQ